MSYRTVLVRSAIALAFAAVASPASADEVYDAPAISDVELGRITGAYLPWSTSLSAGQLNTFQDDIARSDFRLFGSINGIIMDNWWAGSGAELLSVTSVSANPQ